ncbi:MAG TPA: hypothetical protein PLX08_07140 [Bacteroidales bacterium]|jgi:hypothetical protein|nr:hypothetical protein [Bacteroidales bacterium]
MVKKISFSILALAILATGIYAFARTNYWERSVRIFSYDPEAGLNAREGHARGGIEGRRIPGERSGSGRPDFSQLPDSVRARVEAARELPESGRVNFRDSLRRQSLGRTRIEGGRPPLEGGFRDGSGRGRGEFPAGKSINLRNVKWFLAVFAMFTVIAIYLDKAICLIRRKNKNSDCPGKS